ncbi:unnamed protein product [Arabidopsis lyrata]|nr:unnamed protein product [Arabidopsis lyrata]
MAFIQDLMLENVSSAVVKQRIITLANRLGIEENRSMFLLILYNWKEEDIIADLTSNANLSSMLRYSLPDNDFHVAQNQLCSVCGFTGECGVLDCQHHACPHCLTDHVNTLLDAGNAVLICPAQGCNKFLNPSALSGLPILSRTKFTERILKDFITKVENPHPLVHLKRGLEFVWVNRGVLFTTGLAGAAAFGTNIVLNYRRKHPQTWRSLGIITKRVARGEDPATITFGWNTWLEARFGIGS